jgi:pyruvate-formate lyase-activating enzyme
MQDEEVIALADKFVTSERQIIGVSTTFLNALNAKRVIQLFLVHVLEKFPKIRIVVGGANHLVDRSLFPGNTVFLLGQNRENEIIDLFNSLTGKIKKLPFNFLTHSVNYRQLFPTPVRGVIMHFEMSKGCIFNCSFCNYQLRKTKSQFKSAKEIIQELEAFYQHFGTPNIFLLCNTFNDDEAKILELAKACEQLSFTPRFFAYTRLDLFAVQSEKIRDFFNKYVKFIWLGIESFSKESLRVIKKSTNVEGIKRALLRLREENIDAHITASFIVGLPGDSFETLLEATKWCSDNKVCNNIVVNPLRINPVDGNEYLGLNEFSEFDVNYQKFGFSIYKRGEEPNGDEFGTKSFYYWEREDGYNINLAIRDADTILKMFPTTAPYQTLMLGEAQNIDFKNLAVIKGLSTTLLGKNLAEMNEIKRMSNKVEREFVHKYYQSLISE